MENVRAGPFEIGIMDLAYQMIPQGDDKNSDQPRRQMDAEMTYVAIRQPPLGIGMPWK